MDTHREQHAGWDQAMVQPLSRMPFKEVMQHLTANELEDAHRLCIEHNFRPKLGQLLIASGRLSACDLDSMLLVHDAEGIKNVPMGKLLVIAGLMTGEELALYFALQKLLKVGGRKQDEWGVHLVERGIITQDQLNTAMNDVQSKNTTLKEALVARNWISKDLVEH
jgi:hypothetical protein